MADPEQPRSWRRTLMELLGWLKRGILGRSAHAYMKQFGGSDAYWDRAIAAQLSCSRPQGPKPDADRPSGAGGTADQVPTAGLLSTPLQAPIDLPV
jgi:hypothetical protein